MSDWIPKEDMMRRLKRSERTLQQYVKDGKLERRTGEDKRAWYRETQRDATERGVAQRDAAEAPPWAVELLEEIRALRAEIAAQRALQAPVAYTGDNADPPVAQLAERPAINREVPDSSSGGGHSAETPPRNESQRRSDPQREGFWARLFGGRK